MQYCRRPFEHISDGRYRHIVALAKPASALRVAQGVPAVRICSCTAASKAGGRRTGERGLGMVQASQGTGARRGRMR
jgi:hypothetical protein